ncbi:MAG TPA: AMP-binding protein [Pseudonocardia sp.]|nr:AMP-binding protein [Pseudonocardia sp.]
MSDIRRRVELTVDADEARGYRDRGWWRDRTIAEDFLDAVASAPDKTAIVSVGETGVRRTLTFSQLADEVDRLADALYTAGVRPGEVVSMQLPNWWEFAAVHLACARVGAVTNPITPILRHREVEFILRRTASRVCIVPSTFRRFDYARMLVEVGQEVPSLEHIWVIGDDLPDGTDSFAEVVGRADGQATRSRGHEPDPDGPAQIQFTSGTTGEPKGVVHTFNTLALSVRAAPEALDLDRRDVVLMASPLSHNTGFMFGMSMPLMYGMTTIFMDTWNPDAALRLIGEQRVTFTMGSTIFVTDLCEAARRTGGNASSLRYFVCGGAPIPPVVVEQTRRHLRTQLVAAWGMTENGIATITRPEDSDEIVQSTDGGPLPWVEVTVVDEAGSPQPTGRSGRLLIKAANEHRTYLGRDDLHRACFHDGWFDTGDLARMTDDGYIRITGRLKDIIIRAGENIPVLEVEAALLESPLVKEVAIVGVPDERLGERACAVVVPADPAAPPDLAALTAHLGAVRMARHFWPEHVVIADQLPKTPSGKVQKYVLRESVLAGVQS